MDEPRALRLTVGQVRSEANRIQVNARSMRVDPLVPVPVASYASCVNRLVWWRQHLGLLLISSVLVLVTATCWLMSLWLSTTLVTTAFEDRSMAYAKAFAASAIPWVSPLQLSMLRSAAQFMLVGSAQYVLIVIHGNPVVDERVETAREWNIGAAAPEATAMGSARPAAARDGVLDIVVPLGTSEMSYIRMGIDTSSARLRVSSIGLWSGALAIAIDGFLLGLLWWLLGHRRLHPADKPRRQRVAERRTAVRTIGDLSIDGAGKRITYRGHQVRLTPKQYALIEYLGHRPDQVCSDREIVENVWQESLYADSKDVKQYVYLLRQRLGAIHPAGKRLIETVPGFGYKLVSDRVDAELTDQT